MQMVVLDRGEETTRIAWARGPYPVIAVLPALTSSAEVVDQGGNMRSLRAILGYYLLWLRAAPCTAETECLLGGPPVVIVEKTHIDIQDTSALRARFVQDMSPRFRAALIGGGIAAAVGLVGIGWVARRRRAARA
jgi:hypothetical protein